MKVPSDGDVAETVAVDVAGQKAERSWSHPGHFTFAFRESIVEQCFESFWPVRISL